MLGRAQDLLDPFLYGEQRGFAGVFDYGNNYPIEQFRSPLDNVCVTEGNGVKAAWIDCNHEFGSTEWGGVGEWGNGRVGEWGSGRVGEWQSRRCGKSSFFLPPSILYIRYIRYRIRCRTSFFLLLFHGMSFVESFEALLVAHKPPVPRLVTDALAIVFGEGHFKAEGDGVGF